MNARPFRLGVPSDLFAMPLVMPLANRAGAVLQPDTPVRHAIALREQRIDAAFLSPLEYARESSLYEIIPAAAASSSVATGTVSLIFREEHLQTIGTVAVDPAYSAEIILAKIILAEEFELRPQFVPTTGTADEMLRQADAVLLAGDASLRAVDAHPNRIDLVEAWTEMAGVPYVHGLWAARSGHLQPEDVSWIQEAARTGSGTLDEIAGRMPTASFPGQNTAFLTDYLHAFSYDLTGEDVDGLQEFIRFAYYHGVLPDVCDINIYSPASPDRPDADA